MVALVAGCSNPAPEEEEDTIQGGDATLELTILEPERGTLIPNADMVTVRGIAWTADGDPRVSVMGHLLDVGADGSFSIDLPLNPGHTSIETELRDTSGRMIRDLRSVLTGETRPHGDAVERAVVSYVGQDSFDRIARVVTDFINAPNVSEAIQVYNPIAEMGDECFGGKADLKSFSTDSFDMQMKATEGGLRITAVAEKLEMDVDATASVACADIPYERIYRAERAEIDALFRIGLVDGRIDFGVETIDTFVTDGSMEPPIENQDFALVMEELLEPAVSGALSFAISSQIEANIEPMLRLLDTEPYVAQALGLDVEVDMRPRVIDFDDDGGVIEATVAIRFPSHPDAEVIYSPASLSIDTLRARAGGFQLGVADDVVNNFLSVLWSTEALNLTVPITLDKADSLNLSHLEFEPLLPPVVETQAGAVARLAVGDCMVRIIDEAGGIVAEAVLSGTVGLLAHPRRDGRIRLEVVEPDFSLGLIGEGGKTNNTAHLPLWLSELILAQVTPLLNQGVSAMPEMRVKDIAVLNLGVDAASGYLVMGAVLKFDPADGETLNEDESKEDGLGGEDEYTSPEEDGELGFHACSTSSGSGAAWWLIVGALFVITRRRRQ
jgi:MYXO-CTERM domain-containing protein